MVRHTLAIAALALCAAAQAQTRDINIGAGDLKAALDAWSDQSGVQVLYSSADIEGVQTRGVLGPLSADDALKQLLGNSGLQVRHDGASAVVIFRRPPAAASAAAAPVAAEPAEGLASITVTAQKRSQAAQSVPISMTTLSARTLEANRVQNLQDVSRLTPGLLVSSFSQANPTIAIRGISNTFSQIGVSKPVAVVVDDVFIPRNSAASFELFDLDSINVLKGPQGTLFGRNVTGGAIVITTRQPALDERAAEAQVSFGNMGERLFNGLVSTPLSETAAIKFSTSVRERDGYGRDRLTGQELDDLNSRNYRAQLLLKPDSDIEATLSADYSEDWNGGRTLSSNTLGDDGNPRTAELGVQQGFKRYISGMSARLNWKLAAGDLTAISAYRSSRASEDYSGVGAHYSLLATGSQSIPRDADNIDTWSHELRYASPKWAAGDFVTGLYYMSEEGARQLWTRGLAARTGALASSTLADQQVDTQSLGVFADGVLHLPATFDLTAGVRYTHDEKTASLTRTDYLRPAATFSSNGNKASWSELTPRVVLSWQPQANLMWYASATRGFTAGGFNGDASTAAIFRTPFDPEKVTNIEAGVKSQWLNNRLRLNASLYKMKYTDKQEFVNNTLTGILSIINAGKATVKGGELEVAYKPTRWLDLSAGYSHLNGVYDSFAVGTFNYTGNRLSSAPANQYSAAANMTLPLNGAGFVTAAANYAWRDTYNTGAAADPNLQIPGYGLANMSIGYESPDRSWKVTAWVKNANDTRYILTRSTQVVRAEYDGEPRTFGLTLGAKF
ncbi:MULTISPECIES: TonB-dependent receptor domain-containing protein [unclassified Duganella]|uniref:TonB-dependent receptor domain-containing protein n=1 Tax=unclassified Duganella TaxID=2636909 RepID=UPI00088C3074|nr:MULTISPECIES: TonB-dependent receptor [unclassified Duganella]SDF65509.1 iron complex outermembrane recepter protein [Duganella sp. OV458]SDI63328.1 iron complex outermembrane recepter protein [Duganella sp. OV510]